MMDKIIIKVTSAHAYAVIFLSNWNNMNSVVIRPKPARIGNFLNSMGDLKGRARADCLNRSQISDKLTKVNATKMPKTERLANMTILPRESDTASIEKIIIVKTAIQGVLRFF
jgi:hypothetical protein